MSPGRIMSFTPTEFTVIPIAAKRSVKCSATGRWPPCPLVPSDTTGDQRSAGPEPLLHPAMAQRYRREAENLRNAMDRKDGRGQAAEHLRALIDKIVLTPEKGREKTFASISTAISEAS